MAITILEWLGGLLVIVLLVATIVALVRLLVPKLSLGKSRALKITIVGFAPLGAIAVANSAGMLPTAMSRTM